MSLYDKIIEDEQYNDIAEPIDMLTPALSSIPVLKSGVYAYSTFNSLKPFLKDLWEGRDLFVHKPFNKMNKKELKDYKSKGLEYYTNFLQNNPIEKEEYGRINFNRKNRGKDLTENFEVYPFLREQLQGSRLGETTNYKNEIDRVYDHLYNTHNGNLYDYLIEKITDNQGNIVKNYKMMKKQK